MAVYGKDETIQRVATIYRIQVMSTAKKHERRITRDFDWWYVLQAREIRAY